MPVVALDRKVEENAGVVFQSIVSPAQRELHVGLVFLEKRETRSITYHNRGGDKGRFTVWKLTMNTFEFIIGPENSVS